MLKSKNVYSGAEVFQLVDTMGLPLEIIVLDLKDKGHAFDVAGFIDAACETWTAERTYRTLTAGLLNNEAHEKIKYIIYNKCINFDWGKNDKKI